jgi:L-cystine uptake protein TcyP (sodium:dicarboxylate symporter family)
MLKLSRKMNIVLIGLLVSVTLSTIVSAQTNPYEDFDWGSEEAEFFMGLGLTICLALIIIPLIIAILLCIWIYKDAEKRGKSGVLWVILLIVATLFLSLIGLIIVLVIWLVVRPPIGGGEKPAGSDRRCPNCGRIIPMDARACPYCAKKFEE